MKIGYVKGLKGLCCIQVSLGHMVAILLPVLYFGSSYKNHVNWSWIIYETPLGAIFNSSSALICFLLLSGFLIPYSKFKNNAEVKIFIKWLDRYFRFMPMAFIGIMLGWLVMKADLVYSNRITDLSYSFEYGNMWNTFVVPGFFEKNGPLYESFIRVFVSTSLINNPLTTLRWIWQFGLVLLGFTKYITKLSIRHLIYGVSVVFGLLGGRFIKFELYYFATMLIGMWLSDLMYNPLGRGKLLELNKLVSKALLGVSLSLLSIPVAIPERGIYYWLKYVKINHITYWIFGWAILIVAISNLEILREKLEKKYLLKLGDISFAYYAIHWPIVISFTCIMTLLLCKCGLLYVCAAIFAIIFSIIVTIIMATFINKYIYQKIINTIKCIHKLVIVRFFKRWID